MIDGFIDILLAKVAIIPYSSRTGCGQNRRRLNKWQEKLVFLAIVFGLHYLCNYELYSENQ